MTTNYDTTNGDPYERVVRFIIEYGTEQNIGLQVFTQQAMVTASRDVVLVAETEKSFSKVFTRNDLINGQFPIVNNVTGEPTGVMGSCIELFTHMASFIRQQEKLNNGEA